MNIAEFRQKNPEYNDMRDMDLARALHQKHYSDVPFSEFAKEFLRDNSQTGLGTDWQNALAGAGQAFVSNKRGVEQLTAKEREISEGGGYRFLDPRRSIVGDVAALVKKITGAGRSSEEVQKDIDRAAQEDKALLSTKAGLAGNIAGHVAMTLPAGGLTTTLPRAAAFGSAYAAGQPVATGESRIKNTLIGGAGGGLGYGVSKALPIAYNAIIKPFTSSGTDDLAAQGIKGFLGDKADDALMALKNTREFIPGSAPMAHEATQNAGIRQLTQSIQPAVPGLADDIALRGMEQNAARLNVLRGIAGSEDDLASAIARRSNAAKELYSRTFGKSVRVDDELKSLFQRPVMQDALNSAQNIAANEGHQLGNLFDKTGKFASVKALHYVKMGLDDVLNGAPAKGIGGTETRAIQGTKNSLLSWMDNASPAYKTARVRFEKMSRPINRMEVGKELLSRVTRSELPDKLGNPTIFPDAFGRAMKGGGESLVEKATGFARPLDRVLKPEQIQGLKNVFMDLARKQSAEKIGRVPGSPTAEYLAGQNLVRNILGPLGAPEALMQSGMANQLAKAANVLFSVPNRRAQEKIGQATLDPKYMAKLLEAILKKPPAKGMTQQGLLDAIEMMPVATGIRLAPGLLQ